MLRSARMHEVEPLVCLADVLDRLARCRVDGDESHAARDPLIPDRWTAEHRDKRLALKR